MGEASWESIRAYVYDRAEGCCEYCQTSELNSGQTMQIDHIRPDGDDSPDNLCLACWNCNNHKRQATLHIDPVTNDQVPLYHPREQLWKAHFSWVRGGIEIHGLTSIGRATVERLKMNRPSIVIARQRWVEAGYHPPKFDDL